LHIFLLQRLRNKSEANKLLLYVAKRQRAKDLEPGNTQMKNIVPYAKPLPVFIHPDTGKEVNRHDYAMSEGTLKKVRVKSILTR
jgi:hypothetical protein